MRRHNDPYRLPSGLRKVGVDSVVVDWLDQNTIPNQRDTNPGSSQFKAAGQQNDLFAVYVYHLRNSGHVCAPETAGGLTSAASGDEYSYARSQIAAMPWPPPMHMVTRP
jgi:hypothetical protein